MQPDRSKTYVFKEKSWEPVVEFTPNGLIYSMPVSCGYFDKIFKFRLTTAQFDVLKADKERRYFLYGALHHAYQSRTMTDTPLQDRHFDLVLFGSKPDVETLMTRLDVASNGAVSNLAAALLGTAQAEMREGRWFRRS